LSPLPYPISLPAACAPLSNQDFQRLRAARPRLWTFPQTGCLTCLDTRTYRWYAEGSREDVVEYECNCMEQWLLHLWLLNAGIGLNYQRLTWDDLSSVPTDVVNQIMDYAVNAARNIAAGRSLFLWSPDSGTGKTLLLTLLIKTLMAQGVEAHFSQFNDIVDLHTSSWRDQAERDQWNRRVRNVDVLGLDDMGKEYKGRAEIVEPMLDQVIRSRVSDAAPVAITTNWTPEQLRQGYGGYVMSLLSESTIFIEVPGSNYRPRRNELSQQEARLGLSRPIVAV
jgi:DNA replication protein DnaC